MKYVYIGIAALFGTALRAGICLIWPESTFPFAILIANIISTFLLAVLYEYIRKLKLLPDMAITALGTGLLGSFSTVSSVANDTMQFIQQGMYLLASANYFGNLVICLAAAFAGLAFSKMLIRGRKESRD